MQSYDAHAALGGSDVNLGTVRRVVFCIVFLRTGDTRSVPYLA